ncbi:MAG: CHAT domain-containing protein [Synechococcales bacterium]|nr:CHAT domain-containing protein [Synechococcales bacterium]
MKCCLWVWVPRIFTRSWLRLPNSALLLYLLLVLIPQPSGFALETPRNRIPSLVGQPSIAWESSLHHWERTEQIAKKQGDFHQVITAQFQQAQILQRMGFYRRAKERLTRLQEAVNQQPDRTLKVMTLLRLGNLLRVMGQSREAEQVLRQGLAIAREKAAQEPEHFTPLVQIFWLALGQTLAAQSRYDEAIAWTTQVNNPDPGLQIPATLQKIRFRLALGQKDKAIQLLTHLRATLSQPLDSTLEASLVPSQASSQLIPVPAIASRALAEMRLYASLELTDQWFKLAKASDRPAMAQWLVNSIALSRQKGDRRAESYALGQLGRLYEQAGQWQDAATVTEQAQQLADVLQANDLGYQWQWQLGRIAHAQGQRVIAIQHYQQAIQSLQRLREDLAGTYPESELSFRDQIEPVYRDFIQILLEDAHQITQNGEVDRESDLHQERLRQARDLLESLQVAELTNYFREACLDWHPQPVDQVDPQSAVIYPILLRDRLEVIVAIAGQPLTHHSVLKPTAELEAGIETMRQSMRPTSFRAERMKAAQQLYDWLIRPSQPWLQAQGIQTLVFVLDGKLQNVPMVALHNGDCYLVESYRIAQTPSLQLLSPKPLPPGRLKILAAGLSQGRLPSFSPERHLSNTSFPQPLPPLPGVATEIAYLRQQFSAQVLLDQAFTRSAFMTQLQTSDAIIVHLASHGQFSSNPEATYLVTQQGNLTLQDLAQALQQRGLDQRPAIELLVLSACQTAQGDRRASLGLAGIAVRSGARSTLASLWTVNDQSTAVLMAAFYNRLSQASTSKAEALRQAQMHLLQSESFSHPYYWAAFTLVGSWL